MSTETPQVAEAVELVLAGASIKATAEAKKINRSTLMRALRRRGVEPRPHPSGPSHHAWIDGRAAAKRS